MSPALIRKLEVFGPLPAEDHALIHKMTKLVRSVPARTDIIAEGDIPGDVNLVVDGFAIRQKAISSGSRQIVAYLMPGDFCDLHVFLLGRMDHTISTLTDVQLVKLARGDILDLLDRPAISRAMLLATLVDEAVLREWLVNNGLRPAEMSIAHFCCEWFYRLRVIGRSNGDSCELPLTQTDISETMGLSVVHTNRSLTSLHRRGLIKIKSKRLSIPNIHALAKFCGFSPNYLHQKEEAEAADSNALGFLRRLLV